jgi:hypothetical protein
MIKKTHYGAAKARFEPQRFLIITFCHDRHDARELPT